MLWPISTAQLDEAIITRVRITIFSNRSDHIGRVLLGLFRNRNTRNGRYLKNVEAFFSELKFRVFCYS